ncbi:sn-glycerol-3-phosphate ABC transporter ATP-binding protein UgpC [Pseudoclavibacter chungangensis]|uniref:sn-glycerol-3-phosphate ABC transporter ATP-binding protein UgpC n=1 Tax=Pseudoclavibacter chungangensis TaxID=587635 RepID=A0A7J5C0E1_9MICO|nr:sn-glycerol-3-phosphate ABC transporter ATP-binding protein UgpC [Pseudoclavibacter chungangensis]KAB1660357.1 sn-glycerol-3-phosphate ABC transporter ATP-binding protein UgpC [Pseudoclavibacter chungangensis]NYJ65716.1 multiple sugar transport system ATP-binding protein [Pseudoclavibacter chungangensis]
MAAVTFEGVTRRFSPTSRPAVDHLDLDIGDGEFLVLVGPSGCGKTTTLRMLAGLDPVDEGTIRIGDRVVDGIPAKDRDIAMVFQNYALYPHWTVARNMSFGLRVRGVPKPERKRRVLQAAAMLDLEPLLGRRPSELSGGQRQRVAMGRAIVREPQVFLMDEPLSNLDAKLRVQTRAQIAELQRRLDVTTVYVTHDQTEAMTMGDRIAVLDQGVLQQLGTPIELYDRPANAFVARFMGSPAMSTWTSRVEDDAIAFGSRRIEVPRAVVAGLDGAADVLVGARQEDLRLVGEDEEGADVVVSLVEEYGSDGSLHGEASGLAIDDTPVPVVVRVDGRAHPLTGDRVRVRPDAERLHWFHADTGVRLGDR